MLFSGACLLWRAQFSLERILIVGCSSKKRRETEETRREVVGDGVERVEERL